MSLKFFFDNNLPPALSNAVNALVDPHGHKAIHLTDRFNSTVADIDWLTQLSDEGDWVVISQDKFSKSSAETAAIRKQGLIVFVLAKQWNHQSYWNKAYQLIRWWPRVTEQSSLVSQGSFQVPWKFTGNGKFRQLP